MIKNFFLLGYFIITVCSSTHPKLDSQVNPYPLTNVYTVCDNMNAFNSSKPNIGEENHSIPFCDLPPQD